MKIRIMAAMLAVAFIFGTTASSYAQGEKKEVKKEVKVEKNGPELKKVEKKPVLTKKKSNHHKRAKTEAKKESK